jgi:hypothetical protein
MLPTIQLAPFNDLKVARLRALDERGELRIDPTRLALCVLLEEHWVVSDPSESS